MDIWIMRNAQQTVFLLCLYYVYVTSFLSEQMKQDILDVHNSLRRNFAKGSEGAHAANMKALVWNDDLARQARIRLRLSCKFSNIAFFSISDSDNCSNIAKVSHGNVTSDIVTWYSEIREYFYAYHEPSGVCHPTENCSHATVVLNADFRYIGCSYKRRCKRTTGSFYCIYKSDIDEPPVERLGSVGQFYTTGQPCTHCTHSTSFCDDGLCTSCDINPDFCDCRKTCSSPHGNGILDRRTCSCFCHYGYGPNCDVPCENPSRHDFYDDYDICETYGITPEQCDVDPLLRQSCPKTCGLCTSCDINPDFCDCRKTCSSPHGNGILDRRTCSCFCHDGYGPNCDVPCENPSRHDFYDDYDICETYGITPEQCDVDPLLRQSCPKTCGLCSITPEETQGLPSVCPVCPSRTDILAMIVLQGMEVFQCTILPRSLDFL